MAEPRRLRHTLLNTAAPIARHPKQTWRWLPDNWPRTPQLLAAYGSPSSRRHPADHPAPTRRAPSASFVLPPTHRPQNPRVDSHDDSTEWRYEDSDLASLGRNGDTLLRRPALVIRLAAAATATRDEGDVAAGAPDDSCEVRRCSDEPSSCLPWPVPHADESRPISGVAMGPGVRSDRVAHAPAHAPSTPPAACANSSGARGSSHLPADRSHGSVLATGTATG